MVFCDCSVWHLHRIDIHFQHVDRQLKRQQTCAQGVEQLVPRMLSTGITQDRRRGSHASLAISDPRAYRER